MISCTFKISQILITSTDCLTKALPSGHQSTGRCQEVQPQSLAVPCALMLAACMVIQAWQILLGHAVGNLKLWLFEAWCISGHRYVAAVGPFQPSYAVVTDVIVPCCRCSVEPFGQVVDWKAASWSEDRKVGTDIKDLNWTSCPCQHSDANILSSP